jgi:CMP-N-acetylneuraminic acid synthetase
MTTLARNVLAILPMRGGSERVPRKNLVDLGGRPLYSWILDTVLSLDGVLAVVDTDDDEIESAVRSSHPDVPVIRRPDHLGVGTTPMNEVLANTLASAPSGETILQVHATNPFVTAESLNRAIQAVDSEQGVDSAFSVSRLQARLWRENLEPVNHDPAVLLRTQEMDPLLIENSSFYAFDREMFLATNNRIGRSPIAIELSPIESVDIDTPEDLRFARVVANGLALGVPA